MNKSVYEVVIKWSIIRGGVALREDTQIVKGCKVIDVFYPTLDIAKQHIKWWADNQKAKLLDHGWRARLVEEEHHNDWETEEPEYLVAEASIKKHELHGYFQIPRPA